MSDILISHWHTHIQKANSSSMTPTCGLNAQWLWYRHGDRPRFDDMPRASSWHRAEGGGGGGGGSERMRQNICCGPPHSTDYQWHLKIIGGLLQRDSSLIILWYLNVKLFKAIIFMALFKNKLLDRSWLPYMPLHQCSKFWANCLLCA